MTALTRFFDQPVRVFALCSFFFMLSFLLQRTPEKIFGLYQEKHMLQAEIDKHTATVSQLSRRIRLAREPEFIEQQAVNLYDLALPDDIIFVFSED